MQECVGLHSDIDEPGPPANVDPRYVTDGALRLALRVAKGAEIVFADERLRRAVHGAIVERLVKPPQLRSPDPGRDRLVHQQVPVGSGKGAEARMEVRGNLPRPRHPHGALEVSVGAADPTLAGTLRLRIEVHDLTHGVHTRVGAPSRHDRDRRIREPAERRLEVILHAATAGLALPTTESRAVVFEAKGDAHREGRLGRRVLGRGKLQGAEQLLGFCALGLVTGRRHVLQERLCARLVPDLEVRLGKVQAGAD